MRVDFTNWGVVDGVVQPDNYGGVEHCCRIGADVSNPGTWDDRFCYTAEKFICKSRAGKVLFELFIDFSGTEIRRELKYLL